MKDIHSFLKLIRSIVGDIFIIFFQCAAILIVLHVISGIFMDMPITWPWHFMKKALFFGALVVITELILRVLEYMKKKNK